MLISDTIRLFLDSIGRSEEYEFYLNKFKSNRSACFSIIIPDLESLRQSGDVLLFHIHFLLRLDLIPALLLAGPQSEEMKRLLLAGQPEAEQCETLEIAAPALEQGKLVSDIASLAERAHRRGRFALLQVRAPLSVALENIAPQLSRRLLFIRLKGALLDREGQPISLYRVRRDIPPVAAEDVHLRELSLRLLESGAAGHIALSSPYQMLKEIFTVKGSGTILRIGSAIRRVRDHRQIDGERLRSLLHESFGREPKMEGFFSRTADFYLEENYRGAILLEDHPAGSYLSKFAVDTAARGEGIAQELWEEASVEHPALFWRSRGRNSIIRWYNRLADGSHREGGWLIFWRGVDPRMIPEIIEYCLGREEDFV